MVLNRIVGSESMVGKNIGEEHTLDVAYKL